MKKILMLVTAMLLTLSLVLTGCKKTVENNGDEGGNNSVDDSRSDGFNDDVDGSLDEFDLTDIIYDDEPDYDDEEDEETDTIATEPVSETEAPSVPEASIPAAEAAPTETQAQPAQTSPDKSTKTLGTSAKGYTIEQKNGIVYVNGILVANKTYSLPSDYNPGDLTPECDTAYMKMKNAAAADGISIFIVSGFRSYATQDSLYSRYCASDGKAEADTYSARPGHSEHQTGLAMDLNSLSSSFADTPEGKWLAANAWKYGFILRYPSDKVGITGYIYEPWHFRYVGTEHAQAIYESGLCLEEYLGINSVYAD